VQIHDAESGSTGNDKFAEMKLTLASQQDIIPSGWVLVEANEVVLAKSLYVLRDKQVTTTFSVIIKEDYFWDVALPYGISIPKTSYLFQCYKSLNDIEGIVNVLQYLDAPICIGNDDDRFHDLKQWRAEKFLGRSKDCRIISNHK
jgi:hypothetical protein